MKQRNPVTKERRKSGRKVLAAVLSLAMILTLTNPTTVFAAEKDGTEQSDGFWHNAVESIADFFGFGDDDEADAGAQTRAATAGDGVQRTADTDTTQQYTLGDPDSTQYDGRVWVDKSVSAEDEVTFGSHKVTNNSDFLVTYSALATSAVTVGQTPTDTVFILDFSTSMTWGYREDHESVAEDESRISAMITSVNHAIDTLVKANPQNRIAIAVFNGASTVLLPDLTTGEDILQKVDDGTYLSIYRYDYTPGEDGGRADVRCNINGETTFTGGGTNIQAGMFAGMKILADNRDTTAEVNGKTVTRVPNVILMSDGAPTTFSSADDSVYIAENGGRTEGIINNGTDLDPDKEVQSGSWWSANSGQAIGSGDNDNPDSADGFMALLTASYYKNAISDRYYGNSGDEANIYTISFGTDVQTNAMVAMANLVLNPEENWNSDATQQTDQVRAVVEAWNTYSNGREPVVQAPIGAGNNSTKVHFRVSHPAGETEAYDPDSLFYPTRYFAAANDEQLDQIFGEIASMITSSASAPTEVTGDPINDGYITYTDTTGQYMEIKNVKTLLFMDEMLDVTKDEKNSTEEETVYVAASHAYDNPAYPGQSFNTDQIVIIVTDNDDNTQTITVKVPAALIPLRTNTVTLDGNGDPTNHETSGTMPLRLCYEVGLAEGIDAETLDGVDADYIKNNSENGKVNFYSNAYTKDGQTNNGVGATVEFEPSPTNPFYFVQEDTPLYVADGADADGNPTYTPATGDLDPDETYYVPVTYYDGAGTAVKKITTYAARSGATLTGYTANNDADNLYLKAGSPRLGNLQDVTASKSGNETGTYGNYREPTFVYDEGSTDPQNGHFLVLLGNNGKLSVPFVSKDVSLAADGTHASIDGQMVGIGEKLHYTIDWVNTAVDQNGDPAAGTVIISDMLPEGTTYVENSAEPDGAVYNKESNTLTWTIKADAGESGTVEFDALVVPAAVGNEDNDLPNNAVITVGGNEYTTNTTVNYVPEKSVSMSDGSGTANADGETVMPGTELTYTIEYRNTESAEATVTITDVVPDGTTFVSANPDVTPDQDGNLTWTIDDVAAGTTGSVSFTVKVDNSAVTTVENKATVKVGDRNPAVTNEVTTNVDRASLIIEKKVTADPGLTAPDKAFEFELTIPSKAGEQIAAVIHTEGEKDQAQNLSFGADGKATFNLRADQSLEISGMGNTRYSVVEKDAANGGFTLKEVKGATGASAEDNAQPVNDVNTATAAGTVGSDNATVTFTNNYSATGETTLTGTKTITGRDFQTGDEFTFSISGEYKGNVQGTTAPMPANVKNGKITINPESEKSAAIDFGEISFTQPGTYVYTISEDDVDRDKVPAVSKDKTVYTVTYKVEDAGNGTLTVSGPVYAIKDAEPGSEAPTSLTWENTYTPEEAEFDPDGDITPDITKQILGYGADDESPEGYTFTLSVKNTTSGAEPDSGFTLPTPAEAASDENGDIDFKAITFTAEGTYEITIAEKIPHSSDPEYDPDMTYDSHKLVYTVNVTDDHKGNLVAEVVEDSISKGETVFSNILKPEEEKSVLGADEKVDLVTDINGQLVGVGDKVKYTVDWVNDALDDNGAPTSATVIVTDTIPEGTKLVENSISEGGLLGRDGKTITWTFEDQEAGASGQVSFEVEITEDAVKITEPENTVANTAQIQVGENNPAQDTNTVENPVPEKTQTKEDVDEVTDGTTLTYQIAFKNTAGENGEAAVVDELTKGQEYVTDSAMVTVNGGEALAEEPDVDGTAADGQTLTWNLTGLAADAQIVLTFDVTVTRDAGATVDNTATVNGHKTNVVTTPYPSESTKDVSYADKPEVSIDGQMVGVGDKLLYTIDWAAEADGELTVTDTVPEGTSYVVDSASENGRYDPETDSITWDLGKHTAGDKGTVTFKVTVDADAVNNDSNAVKNKAQIQIGTDDPQISYTDEVVNYVPEKSVTDNDTSTDGTQVGDTLTYTIQYANTGDEPVDMVITDTLSEGLTYVPNSAGENAQYDEKTRTITWTLTDVPANTMDGQVSFQAVVNENAADQTIENEAKITVGNNPQITTNKTETEVKTGSLMISKMIMVNEGQGTVIDTTKAFTFTVVLTDKKGNTLDGEYSYNGTSDGTTEYQGTITSGGTITLKHNGSVTITGLPEGAKYTVTETPEAGYTANNAELKGNIPAGSAATAAFVNNYSAGQATLSGATNLEVTKEFTVKDWGDEVFTFTLTLTDGDDAKVKLPENADSLQIGKDTPDHKAAFGDIIFTAAGEYTFEISEKIPENPGQIQYDDHAVTIKVNVTDNKNGSLEAVASATTSGSMTFKNTYIPQSITANIQALKDMTGRDLRDTDKFTFTIKPQDGAPATTKSEVENGGQDNTVIDFGYATFTKAGTYTYLITETGGSVAGVTNSTQTVTATVQVDYDEASGTLSSEVSYSDGDGDAGNTFTNVYKADPVVPAEFATGITGTKTVTASEGNSYTMQGGEFSFTLTPSASNPSTDPVETTTITNEADGSLVFVSGPVTYTESGIYTYTIKENDSSEGGITEDGSLYTIVVTVTDNGDGKLAADVSITKDGTETDAITFDNDYDPTKTGVTISGTKELTGKDIENNMFTFQITGDNGAPMPSATEVQNTGSSFAFGTIEYTEPGTYVYHISEVNDGKTGYTYDGTVYDVTVVVTDTDGALHADVSGADAIVFKNSYDPGQVTLTGETALRAHKTLTGRGLNAEEFVFEVKDADGNVLTTGTNDADGNVVFGDLTFDQTGTYNYTISERNDSLGGITYDGTIYTVQIDVTDAGGYLEAAVQYFEGNTKTELPEFENEYTASPTGVSLGASKILTGRDLKDGEFAFVLKDADGNTVDETVNDANGSVKFDEITYDQVGTYRYTVSEVKGDDTTITYDETVYDVTVEVTDNGIGALEPVVTIGNGESQGIVFTNEYNEPENPTPGNEDTPDDKTPDKKPDNGGTTQSSDRGNVQTGDTAQFIPVVAALLASLLAVIAIAVIMIRRRRR